MSTLHIVFLVIGFIYSLMIILACISQYYGKKVTLLNNTLMLIGGVILFVSLLIFLIKPVGIIVPLIISLVLIHVAAILNGLHMYKKLNISHHLIRLCISVLIVVLYLLG